MFKVGTILFLLIVGFQVCAADKYYVTPTPPPNSACPNDSHPCYTLDQYHNNFTFFFGGVRNITLLFLGGVHNLTHQNIFFVDYYAVEIASANPHEEHSCRRDQNANIYVIGHHNFKLLGVVSVYIHDVTFISRKGGSIFIKHSQISVLERVYATNYIVTISLQKHRKNVSGELLRSRTLTLQVFIKVLHCTLNKSKINIKILPGNFSSLQLYNIMINHCKITGSKQSAIFIRGQDQTDSMLDLEIQNTIFRNITSIGKPDGGVLRIFLSTGWVTVVKISNSSIQQSAFQGLIIKVKQDLSLSIYNSTFSFHKTSSIRVVYYKSSDIKIVLDTCILLGSGKGVVVLPSFVAKTIDNSTVVINVHRTVICNHGDTGMITRPLSKQMFILNITDSNISHNLNTGLIVSGQNVAALQINIQNTSTTFNKNGGIFIVSSETCTCSHIFVHNCTLANNYLTSFVNRASGPKKTAAGLTIWSVQKNTSITIKNVNFVRNQDLSPQPVILQVVNSQRVTIENCKFLHNHGSSIQAYFSQVTLSGYVMFKDNIALKGGGVSLLHSRMLITKNTSIDFIQNKAESVGGAIFIQGFPKSLNTEESCFYQLPDVKTKKDLKKQLSIINFYNNTAANGGEDIYGASLKHPCFVSDSRKVTSQEAKGIFHFHTLPDKYYSSISSDPQRVCVCDNNGLPQCSNTAYILLKETRFPGESFNLSVVLVGDEFGTVSGTVYGSLLNSVYTLDSDQQSQEVNFKKCNQLEYSIHSNKEHETLILTAEKVSIFDYSESSRLEKFIEESEYKIHSLLLSTPVFVNVSLEACPIGFNLSHDTLSCTCINTLVHVGVTNCEIFDHTGRVHRSGTIWLTAFSKENESDHGVLIHETCPYHYCKEQIVPTDLRYPDVQCVLNHSGILCGGCLPNLSLALGSNQCLSCSNNNHLALLLFFAAAGFLLVLFIKVLDLTVANGTINGLIFYANIVWAYESILFPAQQKEQSVITFLRAFLAWINLDFGIETCFFSGLTAYWKTWLQFVFPIYIWVIVGFMIITSNYFTLAAKIFENNSVPVLATLFLLSYAKLVRTIITVLGFAVLRYPNHTSIVWSFDGNLAYFGLEHSFILVAALLALFLLWLPYVSTLLLVPWLKRKSHLKPLRWINRWKPFYDAYYGPFKNKHHYWVGLSLIIRGVLLVTFSITSATYPNLNILAMILTPTMLFLYTSYVGNVYKNKLLSLFENSSLVNLIFLGSGVFYVKVFDGSKAVIIHISVWLTFVQFVCTILYHIVIQVKKQLANRECFVPKTDQSPVQLKDISVRNLSTVQLRESLLEENI